jgi:SAM-dependent methyltransferase
MYSLLQRLKSWRHGFWYGVSERVRWSRGTYHETPARELPALALEQAERIAALRDRYQVQFEHRMTAATSANNYEYLDILDRAWAESGLARPAGGTLCDIGCASFWYAATLQAFFRPTRLLGVEIEGHRLFRDGRTRIDYAAGYLADLPNSEFIVADYAGFEGQADLITAWFPFVTPAAILAWRLPLSMLAPQRLFARIQHNLRPGGLFVMINHGLTEAAVAEDLCIAAGLTLASRWAEAGVLSSPRGRPPVISCWRALAET